MLILNEEQTMLRASISGFLEQNAPVAAFRRLRDKDDALRYDRGLMRQIADHGWLGLLVEDRYGGTEFGFVGAAIVCEEMGRRLVATPFVSTALVAAVALSRSGEAALSARWLPKVVDGSTVIALASADVGQMAIGTNRLVATAAGDAWVLDGEVSFVADAVGADAFLVCARCAGSPERQMVFLLPATSPGVTVRRLGTINHRNAASLHLDEVDVQSQNCVAGADAGAALIEQALDAGRLGVAAEMTGIALEVFERTLVYLKQRHQFGRVLASYQALQHRMARLHCEIEVLKSVLLAAAQRADDDLVAASELVSLAKSKASQVAKLAVSEAVQLHGGIGMTDEVDIGLFMNQCRAATEFLGNDYFHLDRFARLRGF